MNYGFLSETKLFSDIDGRDIESMLSCLNAREKHYKKDEIIYSAGETVLSIGLVESGSVNIVLNFYRGSSNIFSHIGAGEIFAATFAAIPGKELICDVVAAEDSLILFLDMTRLMTACQNSCGFHQKLIRNMLRIQANNNINLSTRMIHISPKSIRDRLLSYLSRQALENGSDSFRIPFSRQQLADYLGVDRSALSKELGKMRNEGIISCHKNDFTLICVPEYDRA